MKKFMWTLSTLAMFGLLSCGGGSEEAKALLNRLLRVVGIPYSIVVNICQDDNDNGVCESKELQTKVTINKGDDINAILAKVSLTENGEYFLENYDPTKRIIMEIQDSSNVTLNQGKFNFDYNPETQELSILQMMIDKGFLTPDDVNAVREMPNVNNFYEVLFRDFETNLNTLGEQDLSSPRAVLANMSEMADELLANGVRDTLPQAITNCNGDKTCVDETLAPVSEELKIDENESETIKENETTTTKGLLANKTFYLYNTETQSVEPLVVDAEASSWNYQGSINSINISGDRLTFPEDDDGSYTIIVERDNYLELIDYLADGSLDGGGHRLYFEEEVAHLDNRSSDSLDDYEDAQMNSIISSKFNSNSYFPLIENKVWTYSDGSKATVSSINDNEGTFIIKNLELEGEMGGKIVKDAFGYAVNYDGFSNPSFMPVAEYFGFNHIFYENDSLKVGLSWQDEGNSNNYLYRNKMIITDMVKDYKTSNGTVYTNCIVLQRDIEYPNGYDWNPYLVKVIYYVKKGIGFVAEKRFWSDNTTSEPKELLSYE